MPVNLTATEQAIEDVFGKEYLFEIPFYQRPYAWTTDQVSELLDDLDDAVQRDADAPYFLGSIVLVQEDGGPKSDVVDGQQRLTTLTMLLCVLRELSDRELADDIDSFIRQRGSRLQDKPDMYRFSLGEQDRDFFRRKVQQRGALEGFVRADPPKYTDSEQRIYENAGFLYKELSRRSPDDRHKLASYIVRHCFLVVVSASDEDSADRIFTVLNARGLDLSPTDKLKPPVLSKIPPASQKDYAAKWVAIEEGLGRDRFRDLFAHIRTIHRKDKLRGTLDREFRDYVLGKDLTEKRAVDFVDNTLEPYAGVYEMVSGAKYERTRGAEDVNALLHRLNWLDNFDWIPAAMAFFRQETQADVILPFLRDLERLAYGLFILRANVNQRIERFGGVLRAIEDKRLSDAEGPLQLTPHEKTDILAKLDGDIYRQLRVRRPLLLRLDSLVSDPPVFDRHSILSIEHVLPRNPAGGSQWLRWFPDEDERERWTHRLANLVLLPHRKNTRASNFEFELKKQEYFAKNGTTTFALTTQVVHKTAWTPQVLECRQRELIDALTKEWRLD